MAQQIAFANPNSERLGDFIRSAAARGLTLIEKDRHAGAPGALICGMGNSLETKATRRAIRRHARRGWTVFAIKDAITYVRELGLSVTYSVAMDPGEHQIAKTPVYAEVIYCMASSCHPSLYDHVLAGGAEAQVFHSACGYKEYSYQPGFVLDLTPRQPPGANGRDRQQAIVLNECELNTEEGYPFSPVVLKETDEVGLYKQEFGRADTMCGGYVVGNRAIALAKYMGFARVVCAGMDFGWREGDGYYAPFSQAQFYDDLHMSDRGRTDGKVWWTRPDLLASAVDVARKIKAGEVTVIGDSLAAALAERDDAYLDEVCRNA